MVILYDTIKGKYVVIGHLSYLSLSLLLSIYQTTNKIFNTDFRIYKPVQITENTKCEFNIRTRKIKERWGDGQIETILLTLGNESRIFNDGNKGQASYPKK